MKKIKRVRSLAELYAVARNDQTVAKLMIAGASNLGGDPRTLSEAYSYLLDSASETNDEESVLDEVYDCVDLID